jgi:hypothetical protein
VVLFEGVPGSGKSTTSRRVYERYSASGLSCHWALEESKDHPFFGAAVRARHRETEFAEICLRQWSAVVDASRGDVWLLDGCAFQSTVRFMFEQCTDLDEILRYWSRAEQILSEAGTMLVYLEQRDPAGYMRDHTLAARGATWTSKIVAHVESTPRGREQTLRGVDGIIEFWMQYRALCDQLVERSRLPLLRLDCSERPWAEVEDLTVEVISRELCASVAAGS